MPPPIRIVKREQINRWINSIKIRTPEWNYLTVLLINDRLLLSYYCSLSSKLNYPIYNLSAGLISDIGGMHKNIKIFSNLCYCCPSVLLVGLMIISGFLPDCGSREEKDIVNYVSDLGKKMAVGTYRNNLPHGDWTFWDQTGKKLKVVTYNEGHGVLK